VIGLLLEPGPDTGTSARWRSSAAVTTGVPEAREEDGSGGDATRATGPGTGPFAAAGLSAAATGPLAAAGPAPAIFATGAFATADTAPPAAAGPAAATGTLAAAGPPPVAGCCVAAVVAGVVVRAWPAWGAMGARPRYLYGPGS